MGWSWWCVCGGGRRNAGETARPGEAEDSKVKKLCSYRGRGNSHGGTLRLSGRAPEGRKTKRTWGLESFRYGSTGRRRRLRIVAQSQTRTHLAMNIPHHSHWRRHRMHVLLRRKDLFGQAWKVTRIAASERAGRRAGGPASGRWVGLAKRAQARKGARTAVSHRSGGKHHSGCGNTLLISGSREDRERAPGCVCIKGCSHYLPQS